MLYLSMKFNSIDSLRDFVTMADKLPKRIDVETEDLVINGTSLLGLVSVAMKGTVTVVVDECEETEDFINILKSPLFNAKVKKYIV